ncbi:MAG: OB-fold domain-containing protein [Syntrophomonadaceae bacterium]
MAYRQTFRDKLKTGRLWLQYCPACARHVFYPRERCPYCWGTELDWQPLSGLGQVYSYTIVRVSALPEFQPPYIYALVELAEGVRLAANIEDCPLDRIEVGMPVQVKIINREGHEGLPVFVPL